MPRPPTWGTPARSPHYVRPRRAGASTRLALALGAAVGLAAAGAHWFGPRGAFSPGALSPRHAAYDARCEQCHLARGGGAVDVRCQRCHDPASGGRLSLQAHVYFGSLDARRAAAAGELACARCHVEHRGGEVGLTRVDEVQCVRCHADPRRVSRPLRRFEQHPEFAVLARGARESAGLIYSHLTHVTRGKGKKAGYLLLDPELRRRGVDAPEKACTECHLREAGDADFDPLDFGAHCLACHRDALKMNPVSADLVVPVEDLDERVVEAWAAGRADFERQGPLVLKPRVHHADEWILFNLRKLQRELDPQGYAARRRGLREQVAQLERRLVLAQPLAAEDAAALAARTQALEAELAQIDARLAAQAKAQPPHEQHRLDEVAALAALVGGEAQRAEAERVQRDARALSAAAPAPAALPRAEFERRREELLRLVDAIEAAAPERRVQTDELRRRLAALQPGETSAELLQRAREQRRAALARLADERRLRASGSLPPAASLRRQEVRALERAREAVERRLALDDALPEPPARPLSQPERRARLQAVADLTLGCRYCHAISPEGAFAPAAAARPVLWRATFRHREHLTHGESCASCHTGTRGARRYSIETSDQASDLSVQGVDGCRACHRAGGATRACQACHDFHPREAR